MSRSGSRLAIAPRSATGWLPWLLGGAFIVAFALRDLMLTRGLYIEGAVWGRDFVNVWTGGHLVRQGSFSAISDVFAYEAFQHRLFAHIGEHNYSYPPVTYPVAALFSYFPYPLALVLWQAAGIAFFLWAAKPWWPGRAGPAWLAVLTPAALVNLWAGHYGFFLGGLLLLGWRQVELGRPMLAGLCFGLMLIKPHLAVLVPIALAMRREWKTIAWAAATVFFLLAVSAWAYGLQPWYDFLFGTSRMQANLINARDSFFGLMSTSPATAAFRLGAPFWLAMIVQAAFAVGGIYAVVASGLSKAPLRDYALLTSTATFVVLPYAFNYDMTVPMIGAIAVMAAAGRPRVEWRLAFYGFIAPQFGMVLAAAGLPLMPLMIAGLLYAQLRMIKCAAVQTPESNSALATPQFS